MDDYWNPVDMERAADAPDQEHAVGVIQTYEERIADLESELARLSAAGFLLRMLMRRQRTALRDRLRAAKLGLTAALDELGAAGVGSSPGDWGVFSGVPRFHLEKTLLELASDKLTPATSRDRALQLHRQLPQLRVDAYRGDQSKELNVQDEVLALAATVEPSRRRALVEHLPGHVRPLPMRLNELERSQPPITMFVSRFAADVSIKLHDIVVPGWLAGRGLGTAALIHLCRYADHLGASITGQLNPGPGYRDLETRLPRLAKWYARHGFAFGDRPATEWQVGFWISRNPGAEIPPAPHAVQGDSAES